MNRRVAVLLGLLLQLIAVFAIFLPNVILRAQGTPATLRTLPVDPRSIFRGDYVTLAYEIGDNLPIDWDYGTPVYAVLKPAGDVYEKVRFSDTKPELAPGEICLRGTPQYGRADFPDIAQYFVEEDTGHEFEQARNAHRMLVEIAVGSNCRAVITGVRLGPEVPPAEFDRFLQDQGMAPAPMPAPVETKPAPAPAQ